MQLDVPPSVSVYLDKTLAVLVIVAEGHDAEVLDRGRSAVLRLRRGQPGP